MSEPDLVIHHLDGVPFQLKDREDLSFVQDYGSVFRVFDDQDSGNICFGVDDGERKRFIKVAGARTVRATNTPAESRAGMFAAADVHRDLIHPNIVRFLGITEHGNYVAAHFDWLEGILIRRVHEKDFQHFRSLPVAIRLRAFDQVINTLHFIHRQGYVGIDIYDATFMYNPVRGHVTMIDLEAFRRKPLVNTMGRMWGSSRFMSPEEFTLGADIDEITNVYTLGAVGFLFFGDERNRVLSEWDAGDARFDIATRATSNVRTDRFQTIAEFARAWRSC